MSTRCSVVYIGGLHIFEEVISGEICIELDYLPVRTINDKYGVPVVNRDELKAIADELLAYLGKEDSHE